MAKALSVFDFLALRDQFPLIDVRSESEFAAGHILSAANIPLLNDAERVIVGTTYKQKGQREAIHEGFRLVGPRLAELMASVEKISDGREILVHCWRGGMRSGNFCQFASMVGVTSRTLEGGYKAYRQEALKAFTRSYDLMLITGCTGSGKSELLRQLEEQGEQVLDLEKLASHRGSAFGGLLLPPQPTTEQFQNDLFEKVRTMNPSRRIWVEDESLAIGKIFLPSDLWLQMQRSAVVQINVARDVRVQRLVEEYGGADRDEFLTIMQKVTRKLGGQNFNLAKERLLAGDMAGTIDILLEAYYDKAYLESIRKKKDRIIGEMEWDGKDIPSLARALKENFEHSHNKIA